MPSKQRTFELVDVPKAIRPMTSKQAKKAYQKANRTPRISKAEQKRRDAEELAKHRKAYEKEQAAAKAKVARDKKAAKALEQKEERKRLGIPEPSRHVRASQSRISMFMKQGNKRLRETGDTGEESEDTLCGLDEEPPLKRVAHDNTEDEVEILSEPIALDNFENEEETPTKELLKKNSDASKDIPTNSIAPDDSEDEFGDFPPLSDDIISLLGIGSMNSTPANGISDRRPGSSGSIGPSLHERATSINDQQELPQMKNIERGQVSADDPFHLEDLLDSQIRSEAADAAGRSDPEKAVPFEKGESQRGYMRPTTSTLNRPVREMSGERELLWHAPINGRQGLAPQSINSTSPLAKASAAKVSYDNQNSESNPFHRRDQFDHPSNQNFNGYSIPGANSRSSFGASDIGLHLAKKPLHIGLATSNKDIVNPSNRALSRTVAFGKQVLQEGSFDSPTLKTHHVEKQSLKYSTPNYLKQRPYLPRKSPAQASKTASNARTPLQERSINMGPPALPQKSKPGMPFTAPLDIRQTVNSFTLPPSSTQAFLESHLDEFFPSSTQEARELCEDPIISGPSISLKTTSATLEHNQKPGDVNDDDSNAAEDDFGVMLSTQELRMFSQDWESANSPHRQEKVKKHGNENDYRKKMLTTSEDIENLICSQVSFFSSQELFGLEPMPNAQSLTKTTLNLPQVPAFRVDLNQYSTPMPQTRLTKPLHTSNPQINPEIDLTPKPRRSPWFKEKPEDKHIQKRFFTEKPEDLEAAAIADSKKAWEEIKEANLSDRHNFDDDPEPEADDLLRALAESKEWDEVYKAVVPTPTPRKSEQKGRNGMDIEEKQNQTPSRIVEEQIQGDANNNGRGKFERGGSVSSTDYGDGEESDWDGVLEGL